MAIPVALWTRLGGPHPWHGGVCWEAANARAGMARAALAGWRNGGGERDRLPALPVGPDPLWKQKMRIRVDVPGPEVQKWLDGFDRRLKGLMYARLCLYGMEDRALAEQGGMAAQESMACAGSVQQPARRADPGKTGRKAALSGLLGLGE